PGETSGAITAPILADPLAEPDEYFTARLSAPPGAALAEPALATVTIHDGSAPTVQLSQSHYVVREAEGSVELTLTLSKPSSQDVTVRLTTANGTALAGADFVAQDRVVTFAAGQTSQTVAVPLVVHQVVEPTEAFTGALSAPAGALIGQPSHATVLIQDSSSAGVAVFALQGQEFDGTLARFAAPAGGPFSARVYWGDGDYAAATVDDHGDGSYAVRGWHTWLRPGPFGLALLLTGAAGPHLFGTAALVFAPRDEQLFQAVSASSVWGSATVSQGVEAEAGTFDLTVAARGSYHFERTAWEVDNDFQEVEDGQVDL